MKNKLFLLATAITLLTGCGKDETKTEQEVWVGGYTRQFKISDNERAQIYVLFFKSEDVKEFTPQTQKVNASSHYAYSLLEATPIYAKLVASNELLLPSGKTVKPIKTCLTTFDSKKVLDTITLPLGEYFVVAFSKAYLTDKLYYWNKYACRTFSVYDRYNPLDISVVIPGDITQYGCVPWLNWGDPSYDF